MRCIICDATDKWTNVDEFRHAKKGMCICEGCGFVSYPELYKTESEIKEHYRNDSYRQAPGAANLFSGQRKIHYHEAFLRDTFDKWVDGKKKDLSICEVGSAYGLVLAYFRGIFPDAKITGTELTLSFR